eukprot:365436-Chlamydomonas_euryale.AAC.13
MEGWTGRCRPPFCGTGRKENAAAAMLGLRMQAAAPQQLPGACSLAPRGCGRQSRRGKSGQEKPVD